MRQEKSTSQTMALDYKSVLASALTVICIIFLNFVNTCFYSSILTLIEGLKLPQKYRIIINLSEALSILNPMKIG